MTPEPRRGRCPAPKHLGSVATAFDDCLTCANSGFVNFREWTPADDAKLRELFPVRSPTWIALDLARCVQDVYERASVLKVEDPRGPSGYIVAVTPFGDGAGMFGRRTK